MYAAQTQRIVVVDVYNDDTVRSPPPLLSPKRRDDFVTVLQVDEPLPINPNFVTVLQVDPEAPNDLVEEVAIYRLPGERLGMALKFEGGVNVNDTVSRVFIQSINHESPAARAQCDLCPLKEGDEILKIDDQEVSSMTRIDCVSILRDAPVCIRLFIRHQPKDSPYVNGVVNGEDEIQQPKKKGPPPPVPPRKTSYITKEDKAAEGVRDLILRIEKQQNADKGSVKRPSQPPPLPPRRPRTEIPDDFETMERPSFLSAAVSMRLPGWEELMHRRAERLDREESPVLADVTVDLLADEELHYIESESDDTGSSVSTVIEKFSRGSTANSSFSEHVHSLERPAPPFDLKQVLSPFERLERELDGEEVAAVGGVVDSQKSFQRIFAYDDGLGGIDVTIEPPESFQDSDNQQPFNDVVGDSGFSEVTDEDLHSPVREIGDESTKDDDGSLLQEKNEENREIATVEREVHEVPERPSSSSEPRVCDVLPKEFKSDETAHPGPEETTAVTEMETEEEVVPVSSATGGPQTDSNDDFELMESFCASSGDVNFDSSAEEKLDADDVVPQAQVVDDSPVYFPREDETDKSVRIIEDRAIKKSKDQIKETPAVEPSVELSVEISGEDSKPAFENELQACSPGSEGNVKATQPTSEPSVSGTKRKTPDDTSSSPETNKKVHASSEKRLFSSAKKNLTEESSKKHGQAAGVKPREKRNGTDPPPLPPRLPRPVPSSRSSTPEAVAPVSPASLARSKIPRPTFPTSPLSTATFSERNHFTFEKRSVKAVHSENGHATDGGDESPVVATRSKSKDGAVSGSSDEQRSLPRSQTSRFGFDNRKNWLKTKGSPRPRDGGKSSTTNKDISTASSEK